VHARAPWGLASHCRASQEFWLTTAAMIFDICVEVHCPDRVLRQFGVLQTFPLSSAMTRGVTRAVHRYVPYEFGRMTFS
jgi:hypothetical protein